MSSAAPPTRTPPGVWVAGRGGGLRPRGAGSRGVPQPSAQPGQTFRPGGGSCPRPAPHPVRAPPRRRPRSRCCRRRRRCCCRKMDPGCTSANCRGEEGRREKKEGRTGRKGSGGGGGLLQQSAQPERWEAAEPSVRASPAALLLCDLSLV